MIENKRYLAKETKLNGFIIRIASGMALGQQIVYLVQTNSLWDYR
ncbi:hypothetical protein [Adhaeribacter pallidiroseus]|nr:hypothetical protein [Adhaeribacter pallidiroseus]